MYNVFDAHDHVMIEIANLRNHEKRRVFSEVIAPRLKKGGVKILSLVISGDHGNFIEMSDLMVWGTLRSFEMILEEESESSDSFKIIRTKDDLAEVMNSDKIGIILTFEGGRPLEGRPYLDTLDTFRIYYRLGLRHFQFVDQGRNRLADGHGNIRVDGKMTPFGLKIAEECQRLGVVMDVAHMGDRSFYDLLEHIDVPVIDSHSNVRELSGFERNLTDERLKTMAEIGGVVGISFFDALVSKSAVDAGERATIEHVLDHICYMADLIGADHIGLGPDFCEFPSIINHGFCPVKGYFEGNFVGVRETYGTLGLESPEKLPNLTTALEARGFQPEEVEKIMFSNFFNFFRQQLPNSSKL